MTFDGILGFFNASLPLRLLLAILSIDLLKGSVLVLLAALLARLFLRGRPGSAQALWLVCLLSLIALPLLWLWLPPLRAGGGLEAAAGPGLALVSQDRLLGLANGSGAYPALVERAGASAAPAAALLVAGLWLAGVLLFLARLALGLAFARGLPLDPASPAALRLAGELSARLGIRRRVELGTSPGCAMPFAQGVLSPRILLPEESASWSEERLRMVLLHELAHVRHRDNLANLVAGAATSLLWCIPLSWIAAASMRMAQEKRADMAVLSGGIRASSYASELLEIGRSGPGLLFLPGPRSAFGRKNMLKERITGIMKPGRAEGRSAAIALGAFCLAAALSMATCSSGSNQQLVGSWIPDEGQRNTYKYEYTADGKVFASARPFRAKPDLEGRFTVESRKKDAQGATIYTIAAKWSGGTYDEAVAKWNKWYTLVKIDPSGKSMQSQSNGNAYPAAFNPDDRWYGTHHKQ
jgi:beta-lactamase regulating signal transducer with metallopeptidase domain